MSLIYNPYQADFFNHIDGRQLFNFHELPENPGRELISKLDELNPAAFGKTMIYVGGDSRVCVTLTQYLRHEPKWSCAWIKAKPLEPGEKRAGWAL